MSGATDRRTDGHPGLRDARYKEGEVAGHQTWCSRRRHLKLQEIHPLSHATREQVEQMGQVEPFLRVGVSLACVLSAQGHASRTRTRADSDK